MPDTAPPYDIGDLQHYLADALQATVKALQCACDARVALRAHQALLTAHEALLEAERHAPPPRHRHLAPHLAVDVDDDAPF